jgi:ATP-dependent Clp protease ATP-binding subunit ClpA
VVVLAQEEARELRHDYIGTEHLLLGLLREQEGLAARVLAALDVMVERVRAQIVRIVGAGEEPTAGMIPFTARAKRVLELSLDEAVSLGHNHIGTESILLGLVRENDGVAIRILLQFDADAQKIRHEISRTLAGPQARTRERAELKRGSGVVDPGVLPIDSSWFDGLATFLDGLTAEIRRELRREPDTGDLLIALGCAPETLAGRALRGLGVNLDELPSMIQRIRA